MADIVGESEVTENKLDLKLETKYPIPRTSHADWRTGNTEMNCEIDCKPFASGSLNLNLQKELKFTDEESFIMQEIEESIEETQITPDIFDIEGKTYYLDDILGSHSSDECYTEELLTSDKGQNHKKSLKKKHKLSVPNESNSSIGQDSNLEEISERSTKDDCMKRNAGKNISDGDNPNVSHDSQKSTLEVGASNF